MRGRTKHALIAKSREAALTAVQTYNNPLVRFKSETFIVLMTIAWTYLLHAYYARAGVDYRHVNTDPKVRRRYARTAEGGYKWWELAACLKSPKCPLDTGTATNLSFLIGLRNEIEHHRPPHLDDYLSGRYLACALNYDHYLTEWFGPKHSLSETVAMALQFRELRPTDPLASPNLPARISRFIDEFEGGMTEAQYNDPRFSYRLLFQRKTANRKGQADRVLEFMKPGDEGAGSIDPEQVYIKETERPKYRRKDVLELVHRAGYEFFGPTQHTELWHRLDAKNAGKNYGVEVAGAWYWYETWVEECKRQCQSLVERKVVVVTPKRTTKPESPAGLAVTT